MLIKQKSGQRGGENSSIHRNKRKKKETMISSYRSRGEGEKRESTLQHRGAGSYLLEKKRKTVPKEILWRGRRRERIIGYAFSLGEKKEGEVPTSTKKRKGVTIFALFSTEERRHYLVC